MPRYERAPRHVVEARYAGDYQVWLHFSDGREGLVDLADELYGELFEPLRDRHRFAQFILTASSRPSPGSTEPISRRNTSMRSSRACTDRPRGRAAQ
jgi:Protein of unknown function (DUF2442)